MASWRNALAGFVFASAVPFMGCHGATTPTPTPTPEPTPTPGGPLACSPKSQTVAVLEFARLVASGGETPYQWDTTGSGLQKDSILWLRFGEPGDYQVVLRDRVNATDSCLVRVSAP